MEGKERRETTPKQSTLKFRRRENEHKETAPCILIFVGLVIGIVAGLALMAIPGGVDFAKTYVKPFGTIFLNLIKFIVVPIVLFSITAGIISMGDIKKLGSVGVKTIVYYMCTTALAVVIALVLANLCRGFFPPLDKLAAGEYTASDPVSFMDTLVNIFPANVIEPMRSASMLQVIVIAILFGVGILVAGEKGLVCAQVVDSFNEVSMKVMDLIIRLSPVGVACLLAPVVAENGPKILGALAAVLLVAYIGYVIHALCVYSFSMAALARISPVAFFREMVPAMMMALLRLLRGHPALHPGVRREAGGPEGDRLLHHPPGGHHQHGRHRHLSGRVRRVHRLLL